MSNTIEMNDNNIQETESFVSAVPLLNESEFLNQCHMWKK